MHNPALALTFTVAPDERLNSNVSVVQFQRISKSIEFVHCQGQKCSQKHIIKKFVWLHNHYLLLSNFDAIAYPI